MTREQNYYKELAERYYKQADGGLRELYAIQATLESILKGLGELEDKGDILVYLIYYLDAVNKDINAQYKQLDELHQYDNTEWEE